MPTLGWIDDIQHRVLRVRRFLVAEIHTGCQADVDAPRGEPNVDVRSHRLSALAAKNASRLDCADGVDAGRKICPRSRPSAKSLIEWLVLVVGGMIVPAGGVGLPGLEKHVLRGAPQAVEHAAFDRDAFALDAGGGEVVAKILLEYIEARLMRDKPDMHVGPCRLRGGLGEIAYPVRPRRHFSFPGACFQT